MSNETDDWVPPDLTDEELQGLKNAKTEAEWTSLCLDVKKTRRNGYPRDWFAKVIQSGLVAEKSQAFTGDPNPIKVSYGPGPGR